MPRSPLDEMNWLDSQPKLEEIIGRYPSAWESAGAELMKAAQSGRVDELNKWAVKACTDAELWKERIRKSRSNLKVIELALPHIAKSKMSLLALDKCVLAANSGKTSGKVRFNLANGLVIQKLLFSHDLVRKPVSLGTFNFFWRFITQKRLLMPLVQSRGIYCFYSKQLIAALGNLINDRSCLEIAAGDGTLARFLNEAGFPVKATDDRSWNHVIDYQDNVETLRAKQALIKYQPQVVLCSWPPPGNNFEHHVFACKSVETYIVIGSNYKFASSNWAAYAAQDKFDCEIDQKLSSYVIPPELGSAVIIFKRKNRSPVQLQ